MDIYSPLPGVFYRKPNPDSEPFVEVGTIVQADTTVCIIEVMKSFNELKAEVAGKVLEILVEDGAEVAAGDVLMRIG